MLQNVTGIELNQEIDLFCDSYTDHLLCHKQKNYEKTRQIAKLKKKVFQWICTSSIEMIFTLKRNLYQF